MISKRLFMFLSGVPAILFFVLGVSALQAQTVDNAKLDSIRLQLSEGITGAWQINYAESEDVRAKIQEKIANLNNTSLHPEKRDTRDTEIPALSISLFPPEKLVLATESDTGLTINENFSQIVNTRTVQTDGSAQRYKLGSGTEINVRAIREDGKLIIETFSPRGNKMTETYQLASGGKKLDVDIRIENSDAQEMLALHRVYDRTLPEIFLGSDTEDAQ